MNSSNKVSIELVHESLVEGNFNPNLSATVKFVLGIFANIYQYRLYVDNLVSKELIDIYRKRLTNLSGKRVEFGGLAETIISLTEESSPSYMLTADTENYHLSILIDEEIRVVGIIYVENSN